MEERTFSQRKQFGYLSSSSRSRLQSSPKKRSLSPKKDRSEINGLSPRSVMSGKSGSLLNKPTINGSFTSRSLGGDDDVYALRKAKVAEFENSTIVKQRHELNLMIEELKDRDLELNNMVGSHKEQLLNWEKDRRTIMSLNEKIAHLENEIQAKCDEVRALTSKLRVTESELMQRTTALTNAQQNLGQLSEDQSEQLIRAGDLHTEIENLSSQNTYQRMEIKDVEERNKSLCDTLMDLNTQIGQVEAREQELLTILKLKDRDLCEAAKHIAELQTKIKKLEIQNDNIRRNEGEHRRSTGDWKNKYTECWKEFDHYKHKFEKADREVDEKNKIVNKLQQEVINLRKEKLLATEKEKRTEQMLEMQKSKQERTDHELQSMRDLYSQQERDIALLKLNLDGTREVMQKQQERYVAHGFKIKSLDTTRSLSPSKSEFSASTIPIDNLTSHRSSITTDDRSRSPYRKTYNLSPTNQRRMVHSSPQRRAELAYSPTRFRNLSPSYPSGTIRFGQQRSSPEFKRSPERFRNMSPDFKRSPDRRALKSMSPTRLSSPGRSSRDMSYRSAARYELYDNESSTYTLDDTYEYRENVPYKAYSHDTAYTSPTYRAPRWSSTRELSSAADLLVDKYYPRYEIISNAASTVQSDSKLSPKSYDAESIKTEDEPDELKSGQTTPMVSSYSETAQKCEIDEVRKLPLTAAQSVLVGNLHRDVENLKASHSDCESVRSYRSLKSPEGTSVKSDVTSHSKKSAGFNGSFSSRASTPINKATNNNTQLSSGRSSPQMLDVSGDLALTRDKLEQEAGGNSAQAQDDDATPKTRDEATPTSQRSHRGSSSSEKDLLDMFTQVNSKITATKLKAGKTTTKKTDDEIDTDDKTSSQDESETGSKKSNAVNIREDALD